MTTPSNQRKPAPQQNGYNPITLDDVTEPGQSRQDYFRELRDPLARSVAAPLLFFILVFSNREFLVAPLTLLVLLGCLFVRMDNQPLQIAAAPLTLGAVKLSFQMASLLNNSASGASSLGGFSTDPGYVWLPMFFSVCLVFIPRRDSVTFKIILAGSCVLLASGLLPGQGFVAVFYLLDTTLFLAMIVGIFIDWKSYASARVHGGVRAAQ
jgi:hypothetical protein